MGILDHIRKELGEILDDPSDLDEWIDVLILAMDGYWRAGGTPSGLMQRLRNKQQVNFTRQWPEPVSEDIPVEHVR
jgi:hypothetical protein